MASEKLILGPATLTRPPIRSGPRPLPAASIGVPVQAASARTDGTSRRVSPSTRAISARVTLPL